MAVRRSFSSLASLLTKNAVALCAASVLTAGLALGACGGDDSSSALFDAGSDADPSDLPELDAGQTADTGSTEDTGTGGGDASVSDSGSNPDTGIRRDAGQTVKRDSGTDAGSINCFENGHLEGTGDAGITNDTPGTAERFSGSVCGTIIPNNDADHYVFRLKPTTTDFFIDLYSSGGPIKATITVTTDGGSQSYVISPNSSPSIPFEKDKDYLVRVEAFAAGNTPSYQIAVVETP